MQSDSNWIFIKTKPKVKPYQKYVSGKFDEGLGEKHDMS